VTVRAPGEGRVLRVAADVGQRVTVGELLVSIESPEANAALARHRAAAVREGLARRALERAERLLELQGISGAERDDRQAEAEAAAAEAEAARRDLARLGLQPGQEESRLSVPAPRAGVVLEVSVVEGGLVEKDAPLAVVADLSKVWALLESADPSAARVEAGAPVEVRSDALPGRVLEGNVTLVEPALVASASRVRVRVALDNAAGRLMPGQFVTGELPVTGPAAGSTAVPREAVQRLLGMNAVFVETAPGAFELRAVEIGRESAGSVEVLRGLRDGERVAARGAFALKTELLEASIAAEEDEE
jgi:cobalt-zinc-cadmium efflux system membrane fusion protein